MINFDGNMPISIEDFIADCGRLLSDQDARDTRIALGVDDGHVHNKTLAQWKEFESALTNEMAWMRAAQSQRNPASIIRGERKFDAQIVQVLAQAAKMDNLLEAEKLLLRMQWQKLEEFSLNKDFSLDVILIYGLKLKILERLNAFKTDEGSKKLEEIMEAASQLSVERRA